MLTYGCMNVTQDDADVGGGGSIGFGTPASEKNEDQPSNTKDDGANASGTLLIRRVVNAEMNRIGGPELGGLAPVNPGLTMAAAGLQVTGKGSVGVVNLIISLTNNMGLTATTTQGVQMPPTPPAQLV